MEVHEELKLTGCKKNEDSEGNSGTRYFPCASSVAYILSMLHIFCLCCGVIDLDIC